MSSLKRVVVARDDSIRDTTAPPRPLMGTRASLWAVGWDKKESIFLAGRMNAFGEGDAVELAINISPSPVRVTLNLIGCPLRKMEGRERCE
jgi:hypothetical protein